MISPIALERLDNQRIARSTLREPADVVAWLGAVQAQEYSAAKWALGLRLAKTTTASAIEQSLSEGKILRTHVLRPTWHFVTPSDIRWMLDLTASRVQQGLARMCRHVEIDASMRQRAANTFERALAGEKALTRGELGICLSRNGIEAKSIRLALLTIHAELEGIMCSGPSRGKQITYALLATRAPKARRLSRDEALGELATRYFRSHGPATVRDFAWWSGLTMADATRGVDIASAENEVIDGQSYWRMKRPPTRRSAETQVSLLPIYDEYLVAYRDLHAVPRTFASRGGLGPVVIAGGQVVGTWKAARKGKRETLAFDVKCHRRLTPAERRALDAAVARFRRFSGRMVD